MIITGNATPDLILISKSDELCFTASHLLFYITLIFLILKIAFLTPFPVVFLLLSPSRRHRLEIERQEEGRCIGVRFLQGLTTQVAVIQGNRLVASRPKVLSTS